MTATTKAAKANNSAYLAYLPWLRLLSSFALALLVFLLVPKSGGDILAALAGWDSGIAALIVMQLFVMGDSAPDTMRRRAARQDLGRSVILAVIVGGALFSMLGLAFIQKAMKAAQPANPAIYLIIIIATILLSWFLVHVVFSLHYAHGYYGPAEDEDDEDGLVGGLCFPDEKQPDYWDFMYFSFVVGMTCQVSDVQITGRDLRRLALLHGIVSFIFNTIILALTINIVAGII
jgi:uncharacterized membrane protein